MTAPSNEIRDLFDWKDRLVAPFDVRVALDETGIYAGDLEDLLEYFTEEVPGYEDTVPTAAIITQQWVNDELEGKWHIILVRPSRRWGKGSKARVSVRVFDSSFHAFEAIRPVIPRQMIEIIR
ncbi:hypothetical protein [Ruegeria aquimaris]|uniref:Uncharacterized protein n=1 Tax=Ruegeria aquimaris TaxID=2984333 RepID=A0ABT3APU1_9RHOB|nr:hypothetical protein [Ruegeria sp. XHP0148]MCV2890681.1 hypothetical protein [Ruegeria sp. XHP0148]